MQDLQNCFLCVQRNFLSRISAQIDFFHQFITLSGRKVTSDWNFLARLPKRHSTCPRKNYEEISDFFGETVTPKLKSLEFRQRKFGRVVKTALYASGWTFWRKILIVIKLFFLFRTSSQKNWDFQQNIFKGIVKTETYLSGGPVLGKCETFFRNKVYFIFFRLSAKTFRLTGKLFSVGLSKLNFECPEECFSEKISFRKSFFINFGLCSIYFR